MKKSIVCHQVITLLANKDTNIKKNSSSFRRKYSNNDQTLILKIWAGYGYSKDQPWLIVSCKYSFFFIIIFTFYMQYFKDIVHVTMARLCCTGHKTHTNKSTISSQWKYQIISIDSIKDFTSTLFTFFFYRGKTFQFSLYIHTLKVFIFIIR